MQMNGTEIVIAVVSLIFTAVIAPLVRAALGWLRSRTQNEAVAAALAEAQTVADSVVAGLEANVVEGLKARSADDKLTADDAKAVAAEAAKQFVRDLSARSLAVIEQNTEDISAYIGNLIESRLARLNGRGAA